MKKEIICKNTEELICPYCKHEQLHDGEISDSNGELWKCDSCGKLFEYSTECFITFTSSSPTQYYDNKILSYKKLIKNAYDTHSEKEIAELKLNIDFFNKRVKRFQKILKELFNNKEVQDV